MVTRSLNRPSYVLALLLGLVALFDAGNGVVSMQTARCDYFYGGSGSVCASGSGWLVDLGSAVVSAALLALLLLRPRLSMFLGTFGWSVLAFLANLTMRQTMTGPDLIASYRMTIYLVVAAIAAVPVVAEVQFQALADSTRPAAADALSASPARPVLPATPPSAPEPPAG